jgi:hypothetical protein
MAHIRVEVEVDMGSILEKNLMDEVRNRGLTQRMEPSSDGAIIYELKARGCPAALLAALREWEHTPVADEAALERWLLAATP